MWSVALALFYILLALVKQEHPVLILSIAECLVANQSVNTFIQGEICILEPYMTHVNHNSFVLFVNTKLLSEATTSHLNKNVWPYDKRQYNHQCNHNNFSYVLSYTMFTP